MAQRPPVQAKPPQNRPHRGPGELQDLRRKVWQAVLEAEALLMRPRASTSTKLRAIHALTQVATAYQRILQVGDFEQRLAKVEEALQHLQGRNGHRYP